MFKLAALPVFSVYFFPAGSTFELLLGSSGGGRSEEGCTLLGLLRFDNGFEMPVKERFSFLVRFALLRDIGEGGVSIFL